MGIPKLIKYIRTTFPGSIGTIEGLQKLYVHDLYFDVTSLIVSSIMSYYAVTDTLHPDILREVAMQIDTIVHEVMPNNLIYISYDGKEAFSKFPITRQRSYQNREAKILTNEYPISLSQYQTVEYLKTYIQSRIGIDPIWSRCKVIIDPPEATGEAEHKLMDYIRYNREKSMEPKRSVIYSCDCDLIFLALQAHEPDMFILRKKTKAFGLHQNPLVISMSDLETISIRVLRDEISEMLNSKNPEDKERIIDDYVGFACLIGNDFIPPFPDTKMLQLDEIMECYQKRDIKEYLVENGQYNRRVLKSLLDQIVLFNSDVSLEEKKKTELAKFKENKDVKQPLDVLIKSVLEGFDWLLITYTTGVPSWRWMFPDLFSPPLCCVIDFVEDHISHFEHDEPYSFLFGNFASVRRSEIQLGPLYDIANNDPRVLKYFPNDLVIPKTKDGKTFIIPMIDFDDIQSIYNEVLPLVKEEPWLSFSKKATPYIVRKCSIENFEVHSNGPTKPIIRADVDLCPNPRTIPLPENPCALFMQDFNRYLNLWIPHNKIQKMLNITHQRLSLLLSFLIVESSSSTYGTNISLGLTAYKKGLVTPGMTIQKDNTSYYTREAIELIRLTNKAYPKYLVSEMKHTDFVGNDEAKVMNFYTKTMKSIPFSAPSSVLSLPKLIINKIESGEIKASCRVMVTVPCVMPADATGVVIAVDNVMKLAYVLMDKCYGSTNTLHYLLNTPRGIILEYKYIKPI